MPPVDAGDTPFPSIRIHSDDEFTPANGVLGGSGTSSDPFIIEDLLITGPYGRCIEIRNTTKHLLIRNVTCTKGSGASMGISLGNVTNCTLEDVVVSGQAYGIVTWECEGITIRNCTITTGNLKFIDSESVSVHNTSVTDVDTRFSDYGIEVHRTNNCTIVDCRVTNATYYGLYVYDSNDLVAISNTLQGFSRDGIYILKGLGAADGYDLGGNEISDCRYGILLSELSDVRVVNNTIRGTRAVGILSRYTHIVNCSGNEMERQGIILYIDDPGQAVMECRGNTISGRPIVYVSNASDRVIDTDAAQVILVNLTDSRLVDYTDPEALNPVYVFYCTNVTLSNCSISDGLRGITVIGGQGITVEASSLTNYTDKGISASQTTDLTISDNTFADSKYCIEIRDSDEVDIIGNSFVNSTRGVMGDDDSPVWETQVNWTIANNSFSHLDYGVRVYDLVNGAVIHNVVQNCSDSGIQVLDPNSNLTVAENHISNCSDIGIGLGPGESTHIINNTVIDSGGRLSSIGINGLVDCILKGNIVSRSGSKGIEIGTATNSDIVGNIISYCQGLALEIDGSGNRIYLNSFISNSKGEPGPNPDQVLDEGTNEMWDDGKRGNYWSDYRAKYPGAGNDGVVWDTPYLIFTDSPSLLYDRYPLAISPDLERPVARAGEDLVVDEGTTVTLDSSASSDDKGITSFRWTFQYGGRRVDLRSANAEFEFGIPGTYQVTLNVSDAFGNWDVDTVVVTVLDVLAPAAEAGRDQEVDQFTTATLDGGTSYDSGGIANHTWSVEMGGETILLYGAIVELPCDHAGRFEVSLTVTDHAGRTGTDTMTLTVRDREPPMPVLEDRIEATLGTPFTFNGSASTDNVGVTGLTWTIQYDTGPVTLSGPTPSFTFERLGQYPVTLEVTDGAGNTAVGNTLVVVLDRRAPEYLGEHSGEVQVTTEDLVLVFNWSLWGDDDPAFPEGSNFTWSFDGNGTTVVEQGAEVSVQLPEGGRYEVTFTAVDASGNLADHSFSLVVDWRPTDVVPPSAEAGEDLVVDLMDTVVLRGSYTRGDLEVEGSAWGASDDPLPGWEGLDHTFTADTLGEFTFIFRVWDWMGNEDNDTLVVTVLPRDPVVHVEGDGMGTLSGLASIEGTASGDVDIQRVEYRIDDGDWTVAEGTDAWTIVLDTTLLEDGNHTIEVRAWDGNAYGVAGPTGFAVSNEGPDGNGEPDEDGGSSSYLIIGAVVAVVCVLSLVLIYRRKRTS